MNKTLLLPGILLAVQLCSCAGGPYTTASYRTGEDAKFLKDTRGSTYMSRGDYANIRRQQQATHGELNLDEHKRQQGNRNLLNPLEVTRDGLGYMGRIKDGFKYLGR